MAEIRLKKLMKKLKIPQHSLASFLGYSGATVVNNALNCWGNFQQTDRKKLCDFFNIEEEELNFLLSREETKK